MGNRYMNHLPETVYGLKEFQKLGEIEGVMLDEAAEEKDALVDNQWIMTARRNGLLRLAKIMGFHGAEILETEALREEILYRWNSHSPYTCFHLQDWLDGCLGEGNYVLELKAEQYILEMILELNVKEKKGFLQEHLRKIIPANLILNVDLNTNTYSDLKVMTHGQMKTFGWTHDLIPYEDLSPYRK